MWNITKIFVVCCIVISSTGCEFSQNPEKRIDGEWFRSNLEHAHLNHWLAVSTTPQGFFNTAVDRHWKLLEKQPGDLVGQTRTLYVMAAGYEVTGNPAYLEQVKSGADFLLTHYRDPQFGAWFEAVASDGKVANSNKRLYSQAFAIFGLSHAYRVTRDKRYLDLAQQTWKEIEERFSDNQGGYRAAMNREMTESKQSNSQNPLMHLFEALLALHEVSGSSDALRGARKIGDFVIYDLLEGVEDGGAFIPELYDQTWQPLPKAQGGRIDIGHQFEWAYLLGIGADHGLSPLYNDVADRLLKFAVKNGYDKIESGVYSSLFSDGEIDRKKGYWQQAEALRAFMFHAVVRKRTDLAAYITQMTDLVRSEFVDAENGGWRFYSRAECNRSTCPNLQPDGYHMTALHMEALRLKRTNTGG